MNHSSLVVNLFRVFHGRFGFSNSEDSNIVFLLFQFDTDYEEFKKSVEALKDQLQLFVDSWFEKSLSVR